jgi:two-component system OmpR family response regulator
MKVLIVEDDVEASEYLAKALRESGHVVDQAFDGQQGLTRARSERYDAMVLDRMMPKMDGLVLLETLRQSGDLTPTILVSALGEVDERVRGLRAGGDDYLVKPYAIAELLARLEVVAARGKSGGPQTKFQVSDLEMDLLSREVRRAGQLIDLQPREFALLEFLMRHAGQVVTRTMILEAVWDYHFDPKTNVIDVHISRLRRKVDKDFDPPLIHTIRGAGYLLKARR